jgi:hypothetical protein
VLLRTLARKSSVNSSVVYCVQYCLFRRNVNQKRLKSITSPLAAIKWEEYTVIRGFFTYCFPKLIDIVFAGFSPNYIQIFYEEKYKPLL